MFRQPDRLDHCSGGGRGSKKAPENYGGNISEERRNRGAGNFSLMIPDLILTICDCQAMVYKRE